MPTDNPFLWDAEETAEFWPKDTARIILDETDSTMAEARRRAPDLTQPTWILAHHQSGGHGRRGRPWAMHPGNLAATLVLKPDCTPAVAAQRSFIAACALFQTLAMTAGQTAVSLKWPNDVLLNGGKVAGILLESESRGDHVNWLSIGIGVNLVGAPEASEVEPDAVRPVSVHGETGQTERPEDFLFWLASHFADHEKTFRAFGFDPIRRLWLKHAARLGEPIIARTARDELSGTFETIDGEGQLVLRTPKGQVAVAAGDVFF